MTPPRLIPVTKWPQFHAWPTVSALRHLIFHEEANGFSVAICRVGKRVLIDEQAFFKWVEAQNGQQ